MGLAVALALAALILMAGAGSGGATSRRGLRRAAETPALPPLNTDQLAGQRIVYAYAGLRPPASLLGAIRVGEAGGVIFFADNVSSPGQLHAVIGKLQQAALASPLHSPLLMLTDQEGGEVRRLPGAPLQSEKQIGASSDGVALARSAGRGAARTLSGAGLNVNLAPVLDVYRQPNNFIDEFGRSYSSHAATVSRLGAAFIAAAQRAGVAATAKHFPGLGAAAQSQNTDQRSVTLPVPLSTLRSVDEAPYRSALAAGVKLVMTSWAVYPALDPNRPAGLSAAIIQGELRHRLAFHGVAITDSIGAGALSRFGSVPRRGLLAAQAGADLILCSVTNASRNSPGLGLAVLRALASALTHHQLSLTGARQAAARILALRAYP